MFEEWQEDFDLLAGVVGDRSDREDVSVVVVHVGRWRGHYPNIFVCEMARRLGLPTVDFRPVIVFLNGEPRGIYVLTERVMPDGWGRTHFGDTNFFMYVYKSETRPPSSAAHADLEAWVAASAPRTMREAE
ncbi:MAG: CotH kinase family protein, partial [Chloroflexi bacterium]|nr:CotH kinase family protein [Chloroflexota bacterium]